MQNLEQTNELSLRYFKTLGWLADMNSLLPTSLASTYNKLYEYIRKCFQHTKILSKAHNKVQKYSVYSVLISTYTFDSSSAFINALEFFPSYVLLRTPFNRRNHKFL